MATTQVRVKRPLRKARILSNKVRTTLIKISQQTFQLESVISGLLN